MATVLTIVWAIPELAFVGSTESEATESFGEEGIFSIVAPFADTIRGRLKALPSSYFLKLVCLRQDGRILGVHIYGEGSSELIHLGASLVADGNTVFDLQYKSFPAVTLHEVYRNAAMLAIDKLFYSFQWGDEVTITTGPIVGQEDMLAIWPSVYPSDPILDVLTVNGAPGAYNKNKGAGVGISWAAESGARASANYVAANGALSDTRFGGFATDEAGGTGTLQLGWEGENVGCCCLYSKVQTVKT